MTIIGSARLLPQRLQNLHQFGVNEFIAADQVAGLERIVVAFNIMIRGRIEAHTAYLDLS